MNLIILTENDDRGDTIYHLADHRAEHIRTVLKVGAGDKIKVGLLNGPRGEAVVDEISEAGVVLRIGELRDVPSPGPEVDLICALPRPQTLKKVLFTAAMMGVRRLDLVRANRVEKSYFHSPLLKAENLESHLIEGLSQGCNTRLPQVAVHDRFRRYFEDIFPASLSDSAPPPVMLLPDLEVEVAMDSVYHGPHEHIVFAIGPEGGWVPFETELLTEIGFRSFSLGPWVLRVEHAVTAALSQAALVLRKLPGAQA